MDAATGGAPVKNAKIRVIRGGRLIDGNGGAVTKDPVIIVEGKRIKAIGKKGTIKEPKGAEV
ncbi:MAG TPA: hypothetical protein VFK51_00410, partial [Burkholderiales bacterium]|nr:hypothetical protein [Burkholderiales bacterium]